MQPCQRTESNLKDQFDLCYSVSYVLYFGIRQELAYQNSGNMPPKWADFNAAKKLVVSLVIPMDSAVSN